MSFIVTIYGISFLKNAPTSDFHKKITISFHFLWKFFYVKAFYAGKMWHVVQCNTFTWLHASHLKDIIPLYGNMHEGRKYKNAIRVVIICIRTKNTLVFYAIIKRCFCFLLCHYAISLQNWIILKQILLEFATNAASTMSIS